jgi:predicted esterase
MTEKKVNFSFLARYYKLGEINTSTRQIWFVLHGYGQLAQYFIKKFKILENHGICIIAPEGLSRFYLDELQPSGRKNSRVGATWMTKENRLMDIGNYVQYLNAVYTEEVKHASIPVTVLGFSQGSATASRWVMSNGISFSRLILWAGILPPDMDFETGSKTLHGKEVYLVYGKKDPFLNDERFSEMQTLTNKLNTVVKEITFDGEHEIHEPTLLNFV